MAECDSLTGLGNVRACEDALRRRFASGKGFGLLVGDMDYLKQINDERGHAAGDDALRGLATSLAQAIEPRDAAVRIGGDEFAVLTDLDTESAAAQLAARVTADLARTGHSISFGWALAPHEGTTPLSLYRAADDRMYERKRLARSRGAAGSVVALLSPRRG
jgi:diguanylate cyclase (GGDEF)-like protein